MSYRPQQGIRSLFSICKNYSSLFPLSRVFFLAVVVGADRVVANGDTANKVGTYQLAIAAKHHGIPFYVAAPSTSCDLSLESGRDIIIEVRPQEELTSINGVPIAAKGKKLGRMLARHLGKRNLLIRWS